MLQNFSAQHHVARLNRQLEVVERQVDRHRREIVRTVQAPMKFDCGGKINRDHARLQFARQHSLDIGAAGADGQEAPSPLKETAANPVCAVKSHRVIGQELLALTVVQQHALSAASDEFWIGQG